jgi:hypothetical protein
MTAPPGWLPEIISVNGEYREVVARLYVIFETDFKVARPRLGKLQVWWDKRILPGEQYEEGFWHLITRSDRATLDRLHDPRRAERLPWCRPTICHHADPAVTAWDYREATGKVRTYLWLEQIDYVIILEKRPTKSHGTVAFLVTAYHVDGEDTRRSLRQKFDRRCP